jgi:Cation efflux family
VVQRRIVVEAVVAIGAGIIAGSVALIGFGVDSGIEVISAIGLLWRLRTAGPDAEADEESAAEKRALYVVAGTFFLLAAYIAYEAVSALLNQEEPLTSPVGIALSVLSLVIMPALAYAKQRTGREMGSRALVADSKATWVCSYSRSRYWLGSARSPCSGGGGPTRSARWPCCRSSSGRAGEPSARPASTEPFANAPGPRTPRQARGRQVPYGGQARLAIGAAKP